MKLIIYFFIIIILSNLSFSQQKDFSGIWTGKLELPNSMKLAVVFHIQKGMMPVIILQQWIALIKVLKASQLKAQK